MTRTRTRFARQAAVAALALGVAATAPAAAQEDSRYSTWSDPAATANASPEAPASEDLAALVEKLKALVDAAERARAADPQFLQDLRDVIADYDSPWGAIVVADAFADGDYTQDPAWQVLRGEYWIEKDWGLRNKLVAPAAASSGESAPPSNEERALKIFGAILKQATGDGGKQSAEQQSGAATGNAIVLPAAIPNAFALEAKLSSWKQEGHLELGVYQGEAREAGYRLAYEPNAVLRLIRVSSRGETVVERSLHPVVLEDEAIHTVVWTRAPDGAMDVTVDDETLIEVTDRGFKDAFDGIRLSDQGGDFILSSIAVRGPK